MFGRVGFLHRLFVLSGFGLLVMSGFTMFALSGFGLLVMSGLLNDVVVWRRVKSMEM
jgi:hypothetical protein